MLAIARKNEYARKNFSFPKYNEYSLRNIIV